MRTFFLLIFLLVSIVTTNAQTKEAKEAEPPEGGSTWEPKETNSPYTAYFLVNNLKKNLRIAVTPAVKIKLTELLKPVSKPEKGYWVIRSSQFSSAQQKQDILAAFWSNITKSRANPVDKDVIAWLHAAYVINHQPNWYLRIPIQ
jgi:hypothetical protein